jgi:LEA14-like dessication related protein
MHPQEKGTGSQLNTCAYRGVALSIALIASGCIPQFHQPEVRLEAVRLAGLGIRGGTLHAQLAVINPNSFALRSAAVSYRLEFAEPGASGGDSWIAFANGAVDRDLSVAARDSTIIDVPIDFTYSGVGSVIRSILERGTVEYRLSGDLSVTQPVRRAVPFRRTGSVTIIRSGERRQ